MVTTILHVSQQKRHRCEEQPFLWEEVRVGRFERSAETCLSPCVRRDPSRFSAWSRALGAAVLGQPRGMGWGGRREGLRDGGHEHPWPTHPDVWQKPPPCCKVISLQLKKQKTLVVETAWESGPPPLPHAVCSFFVSEFASLILLPKSFHLECPLKLT